jgi:hypothetical protein
MRYAIILLVFLFSCDFFKEESMPTCDPAGVQPKIVLANSNPSTSCLNPNGEFTVEVSKGHAPYRFSVDEENFQSSGKFTNLHAGDYKVKLVDGSRCEDILEVHVDAGSQVLSAIAVTTSDNKCLGDNGSITVKASGSPPYTYTMKGSSIEQVDSVFYKLGKGFYTILVRDAAQCKYEFSVRINRASTGISYVTSVQPIINTNCAVSGCHNGDIGPIANFTQFNVVKSYGSLLIRYASMDHRRGPLLPQDINYIRCWVEDGGPDN